MELTSKEILSKLIAFPTVSKDSNLDIIEYCTDLLKNAGADIQIIKDKTQPKANLYATIGPKDIPGILLSGHTDVVPVTGQDWTVPPFEMSEKDGKLYGRGTTDMKGFVACALAAACAAGRSELTTPLHLALSYDEEIGCVGVRSMIKMLAGAPFRPRFCIVGEPSMMSVAVGHKGKTACRVTCRGRSAHSALAPTALNAIHLACDTTSFIRTLQQEIENGKAQDDDYEVPYTTLHIGQLEGGRTLNIVPDLATLAFEIRNLTEDDPEHLLNRIREHAQKILEPLTDEFPEAAIDIEITNSYPPLSTEKDSDVVSFVKSLTGLNATTKVPFGTEGGLFSSQLNIPTVVCGPGSMDQGHKPDEFITIDQLSRWDAMWNELIERLKVGI